MRPNWVATLHARKYKVLFRFIKIWRVVYLIGTSFLIISCANDELEIIDIVDNEPPVYNESLIIYTDIEPDFTGESLNDSYKLDLNNDEIFDFIVDWSGYESWNLLEIKSIRNHGIISVDPWYTNCVPLNIDSKIFNLVGSNNGEYYASGGIITAGYCSGNEDSIGCSIDWSGKNDKYLGLRINIKGQNHYGWARMEVTNYNQWAIKDYAYNASPDKPILAGQRE